MLRNRRNIRHSDKRKSFEFEPEERKTNLKINVENIDGFPMKFKT